MSCGVDDGGCTQNILSVLLVKNGKNFQTQVLLFQESSGSEGDTKTWLTMRPLISPKGIYRLRKESPSGLETMPIYIFSCVQKRRVLKMQVTSMYSIGSGLTWPYSQPASVRHEPVDTHALIGNRLPVELMCTYECKTTTGHWVHSLTIPNEKRLHDPCKTLPVILKDT